MLSKMAQKPEVRFDKLFQKLYNTDLWVMAYERIAANPGSMTPGNRKNNTADGMGMERINRLITELKTSRYKPAPARRTYVPKADGRQRPIGMPDFDDKLVQTVIRLILEAIYEPQFSNASHGFRPNRSCHTALQEVKKMTGTRWWIEADVRGFFDNLSHQTLLRILRKRITDNRFLHLIEQFLRAGYIEDWQYHHTYSGVPQGGNLSPILSNIYLNELDQQMVVKIAEFKTGKRRKETPEYQRICRKRRRAKVQAKTTGDWSAFDKLTKQMLDTPASDAQDPDFKRMYYCRYADDVRRR